MDISWTDWQVVHAAWTHGSFSAAAEALGIGQATVSRRVAGVEEALGHVLFDRHRTGLEPTPAAHRLRPHLEALATAAHGAARAVDGLEQQARGEVRIAAPPGVCHDWMPQLGARLAATHPDLTLVVLADILPRDLDRREADIALRMVPTQRGDLLVRRLTEVSGRLYASPSYVATLPPEPQLRDLRLVGYAGEVADIALSRFLDGLGAPYALRSNDYLVQRAAICAGLGAGLLGDIEARVLGLEPVPIDLGAPAVAPVYLVVHRALRHVPRVAVVIDAIHHMLGAVEGSVSSGATPRR